MAPLSTATQPLARESPAALWQLRLLGSFALDDGQQVISRLASRSAVQLLMRLALLPGRQHAREELIELLWPGAEPAAARNRLRQTLFGLKAVLEPPGGSQVLQADRRVVWLVPEVVWCDVPAFEQAVRARRFEEARALYRGELLPGFYDEWVHDERQRLQALADRILDTPQAPLPPRSVAAPDTPAAQPAAANPLPRALRLPHYLTRLVGADLSGTRLRDLVRQQPLVTVLGAGGCGKTRLAVEVARHLSLEDLPGEAAGFERVMFVSLVGCVGEASVLDCLLMALQIGGAGDAFDQLQGALDGQRVLMLLDNAEQLDDCAVAALARLAEQLPQVHWLVTSRRPLGLDGEQRFLLEPLVPPPAGAPLDEVALNAAAALFVDRARAHRPEFHVSAANRDSLVALVSWLGGLPLAIELAASRSRSLTPQQMLGLLQGGPEASSGETATGLAWLARRGPRGGRDARQASMLAVMAWSWDLLDAPQRLMLRAVSAFPAGATREAAAILVESIRASSGAGSAAAAPANSTVQAGASPYLASPLTKPQAQALLDDLVDHSLVQVRGPAAEGAGEQPARYAVNQPVREFVASRLGADDMRHQGAGLLHWAARWAQALPATPPLAEVREELPNVLAALQAALTHGSGSRALSLALALQPAWSEIALPGSALDTLDQVLALPALDPDLAAAGHALAAWSAHDAGRRDSASAHVEQALALLPGVGDDAVRAQVLHRLARLQWRIHRNSATARNLLAQALPLAQQRGLPGLHGSLLSLEAHLTAAVDHDSARAAELVAQALALCRLTGNAHLVNAHRFNAAMGLILGGRPADALPELRLLAAEGRALCDWDLAAGALDAAGTALLALRRWEEAVQAHRESLAIAWEAMDPLAIIYALWNIAPALARLRQPELAACAMGHAALAWPRRFGELDHNDLRDLRRVRRFVRVLLPAPRAEAAWEAGRRMGLADLVRAVILPS